VSTARTACAAQTTPQCTSSAKEHVWCMLHSCAHSTAAERSPALPCRIYFCMHPLHASIACIHCMHAHSLLALRALSLPLFYPYPPRQVHPNHHAAVSPVRSVARWCRHQPPSQLGAPSAAAAWLPSGRAVRCARLAHTPQPPLFLLPCSPVLLPPAFFCLSPALSKH
jgi:hypothetical protein